MGKRASGRTPANTATEALAIPPVYFALMDEMMTAAFNPKHRHDGNRQLPPFASA